jgi:hypothetical protein
MSRLQDFLNAPMTDVTMMRVAAKAGDLFGIELECEGKRVDWDQQDTDILKHWEPHADGSLRDHHGKACEWVFNGPVNYKASVARVHTLFDMFEKRNTKMVISNRTSTHVHFNMGDKNAYQAVNIFILFTILEGILDNYCGEDRAGNLFCLSSRHAEEQVTWVENACFKDFHFGKFKENFRYCSLNLASLNKFGTVEFRTMRGLDNREDMLDWLSIINEFTQFACYTMKNPVDILQEVSVESPVGFLRKIFSAENFAKLTKGVDEDELGHSIYEGLRIVQMLCYKIGTEFDQVRVKGPDFWASLSEDNEVFPEVDLAEEEAEARHRVARNEARAEARNARGERIPDGAIRGRPFDLAGAALVQEALNQDGARREAARAREARMRAAAVELDF